MTVISIEEARRRGLLGSKKSVKRVKRPDPPASYMPHSATVLGIDSAKRSGWGLLCCGGNEDFRDAAVPFRTTLCGESSSERDWADVVNEARAVEHRTGRPLVVVMETWTTGGRSDRHMRPATLISLGASSGRWRTLLREAGHPKRRIITVNAMTWRAALLGGPMNRSSIDWKLAAQWYVRGQFGINVGPDAAEGMCIAIWGSRAGRVGALLSKRR